MSIKEIERIRGNLNALDAYRTGINALFNAGIIDALRAIGRPTIRSDNDATHMASQAARSVGWNDCLETLLYFEEFYLTTTDNTPNVKMDFGATERNIEAGDLTKEEANAVRNGESIAYKPGDFTNNIELPKRPSKP